MAIAFEPIGAIYTPFKTREGMPIQSSGAQGARGKIILQEELIQGLTDLDGFSHIILIYHFHQSSGFDQLTTPFLDSEERGVFATRAPRRPNPIGISVVRLLKITHNVLHIAEVDILDGTPLLDIKPYIPAFDVHSTEKAGWTENKTDDLNQARSDKRFE